MIDESYGIADIQLELLDIIRIFDAFCKENGIVYSLYGGSCLGAVRHEGFIPWDNDLDICVTRAELVKLVNCIPHCKALTMHRELWIQRIQKPGAVAIRGYIPTLDVFIIDSAPSNELLFKGKILLLKALQGMLKGRVNLTDYPIAYRIPLLATYIVGRLFPTGLKQRWYDSFSSLGNGNMVHIANTLFGHISKRYPARLWNDLVLVPFEGELLPIVEDYDTFLSTLYGDYMSLPDEKDRVPMHAVSKDAKPYKA